MNTKKYLLILIITINLLIFSCNMPDQNATSLPPTSTLPQLPIIAATPTFQTTMVLPITQTPASNWNTYTNPIYKFQLRYPPGWQLTEVPTDGTSSRSLEISRGAYTLTIQYRNDTDDTIFKPMGNPIGELQDSGSINFMGQEIKKELQNLDNNQQAIYYNSTSQIQRDNLFFNILLQSSDENNEIPTEIQQEADQILESFQTLESQSTADANTAATPSDDNIHAENLNTFLQHGQCFDLDEDQASANTTTDCDFTFKSAEGQSGQQLIFTPLQPARFAFGGVFAEQPDYLDCKDNTNLKIDEENIAPLATMYVCYQTNQGRYGYLNFIDSGALGASFSWTTFDPPGEVIQVETTATTPSSTPTNKPTAAPSNTPAGPDPEIPVTNPDWQDNMSSGANWALYADQHVSFEATGSSIEMTAFNADSRDGWVLSIAEIADFYIQAEFETQDKCSGSDHYGLMVRSSAPNDIYVGYLFGVTCDGRYNLRSWNGSKFISVIPWTYSDAIKQSSDQTNTLGILAKDNRIVLFANGQKLQEISDSSHRQGKFGIFIGAGNTPGFSVDVNNYAYWLQP